jgi:hypothetical protein
MTRDRWLASLAAVLGVSLAACKRDAGPPEVRVVTSSQPYTIPPPHDTVCSVSIEPLGEPFVIGVGGSSGQGVCYVNVPNPHPSANCGPMMDEGPCADAKPPLPNVRAVVRARSVGRSLLEAPLREALSKVLQCGLGPMTVHVVLAVDADGHVTPRGTDLQACVIGAFAQLKLVGPAEIVVDLTST